MRATLVLLLLPAVFSFYLPGVAPRTYQRGQNVELKVNALDSVQTQLPYKYYSLPFCSPGVIEDAAENLGEILTGDFIENSVYQISMNMPEPCKILCRLKHNAEEFALFASRIEEEYRVNWIVDNLPAATKYYIEEASDSETPSYTEHYEKGFPLGWVSSPEEIPADVKYLNNHVRMTIKYHEESNGFRIVAFEVEAHSVKHKLVGEWKQGGENVLSTCPLGSKRGEGAGLQPVSAPPGVTFTDDDYVIFYTYDVQWESSPVMWASRWDVYLQMTDSQIHWFSIINSITIVLLLSGMVAMIMMRTLHRDVRRYNETTEEDQQEETGWKFIHGEVFRAPAHGGTFSVLVGTGAQVFAMSMFTLMFAVLGFLSPANRGGLMTALVLLYVFMSTVAGYYSTLVYKMFKLVDWKRNTVVTSMALPGFMFTIFFILNLLVWYEGSSGAVPFTTLLAIVVLWFGISTPLVFFGSYMAFKKPTVEPPVKVNMLPRLLLPDRPWYTQPQLAVLVGGVLPFGAVFIEIFFIMSSVWLHQFYYLFTFLFIVFIILIITCAEITIVMCYFQLCNEDYHWWWRSYLTSGSSALYLFLYSVLYFFTKLGIRMLIPSLLYFGYMFLVSVLFFCLTGTIGFVACYLFVHKIYSSIHID